MFLISMDRLKALTMTDIKSYFIYAEKKDCAPTFPLKNIDVEKNIAYGLYANTGWQNDKGYIPFSVGIYGTLEQAIIAMETLSMISDTAQEGYVYINPKATIDFWTSEPL